MIDTQFLYDLHIHYCTFILTQTSVNIIGSLVLLQRECTYFLLRTIYILVIMLHYDTIDNFLLVPVLLFHELTLPIGLGSFLTPRSDIRWMLVREAWSALDAEFF